jgi:hypothetical protein
VWQQNNSRPQSPLAEGHNRLTLRKNWAQIGIGRWGFWVFLSSWRSPFLGLVFYALLNAAIASK